MAILNFGERKEQLSKDVLKIDIDKGVKIPNQVVEASNIQLEDCQYAHQIRRRADLTYAADLYHKMKTNDYILLAADRVPGFIKAEN